MRPSQEQTQNRKDAPPASTRSFWPFRAAIPSFIIQLMISTLGAILVGGIAVLVPAILLAALRRNMSGGNFADHVGAQPVFVLLDEPYFIAPIVAGFLLGMFSRRFSSSLSAGFVWILPMANLIWSMSTDKIGWTDVWANYFGSHCGGSECFYEWLFTAPLYTSVAYTFGWITTRLVRQRLAGCPVVKP